MATFNLEELYQRVALSMGKTPKEVEEGIAQLIAHAWPLLPEQDKMAISSGAYPTTEQFLAYLVLQAQAALEQPAAAPEEREDLC